MSALTANKEKGIALNRIESAKIHSQNSSCWGRVLENCVFEC